MTLVVTICSALSVFVLGTLRKMKYCTPIQCESFTGIPLKESNCRLCHNYNSCSFHIYNMLSILDVLSICVNNRKFVK